MKPYVLVARELDGQRTTGVRKKVRTSSSARPQAFVVARHGERPDKGRAQPWGLLRDANGATTASVFFQRPGMLTIPFSSSREVGSWNIHGGVEYLRLGDRNADVFRDNAGK